MSVLYDRPNCHLYFFFFNDTATTEIYPLSLHDALPISARQARASPTWPGRARYRLLRARRRSRRGARRSEEHTSELQSQSNLVCRLLLEKKKKTQVCSRDDRYSSAGSVARRLMANVPAC